MAVKIRLQRRGRKQRPFYHIVVADARAPRDGRFIEKLGIYNPMTKPATIELDQMRAFEWLQNGAQPTDTARAILRFKGVMYYKHLMRGVKKGALTEEQAEAQWKAWDQEKSEKIKARFEESAREKEAFLKMVSGEIKKVAVIEETSAEDDGKSPKAVADSQKTLAEMAAEKDGDILDIAEKATEETVETATETVEEVAEVAQEKGEEVAEVAEEVTETVEAKVEEAAEVVEEKAEEVAEAVEEKTEEVADAVAETTSEEASEEAEVEGEAEEQKDA